MKQGSRLSETIQLFYKDGAVHANRQDIAMIDIVNSTFHSIKRLFLSQNKIKHLHGMGQFKDLRILSMSYNYIEDFRELKYIPPSVENLSLEGNPISNHPNYRLNVIENIPQLKILDTKPIKDSERKDIHEANQLADYIPKLLFALDKLCTKTYKDILILGAQVEQYRKYGTPSPNNVENEFEFSFPSYIPKNGEYKRCVKRIPPLSDVKDSRITIEGVRNLARNMFDETLIESTLDECNNVAELELDRFRLELKESIVKQYKEVKKYANAVACLEKEQKFVVYSGDQTQLYILIKCMVQVANQLFERENERTRLMAYLKYCETNMPKPIPKEVTNKPQTPNIQAAQQDKPKVDYSEKEQTFTSQISKPQDETPRYQRNDSSNGSIEDDDTVVISEDQLTNPEKTISVITAPDSVLEENAFFLTKSTALHYKKWNKLFSKAKANISVQECGGDEKEAERRADEYRKQKLKSKVLESLKYYKDKKQEYRAHYEKKRKLKNIKARSFYVKSLQSKAFTALVQNSQRRQNFKRAIRILRKVRYELILKKFFDSWRSLLLRCSDIRPLTAPPKQQELYDSDTEKRTTTREDSSKNKYYRKETRPQSAGNALTRQKDKENEAEQNGFKHRHRYKEKILEVDGPVYVKKEKKKRKTVVMLSVASNF